MTVPPEAITAAIKAAPDGLFTAEIQRMLKAAAPLIAAAERDRNRQFAAEKHAVYRVPDGQDIPEHAERLTGTYYWLPFADLLAGDQP